MNKAIGTAVRLLPFLFLAALSGCATTPALNLTGAPTTPVDLSGRWVVDPSHSEDPVGKIKLILADQIRSKVSGRMGGMGGGRGGMMGGGGGGMQSQMQEKVAAMADRIGRELQLPDRLEVTQRASDIKINADGRAHDIPFSLSLGHDKAAFRAGWLGDQFVVIVRKGDDAQVVQRYSIPSGRSSLTLLTEVKIKQLSDPITVLRVFVPAKEGDLSPVR